MVGPVGEFETVLTISGESDVAIGSPWVTMDGGHDRPPAHCHRRSARLPDRVAGCTYFGEPLTGVGRPSTVSTDDS